MPVSPAATQVFAVRRAVVTLLGTREALEGVSVTYGWPGEAKMARRMIYTDARAAGEQSVAAMREGRTYYNERARFEVTIYAESVGDDQEAADTECEALALELAECIADNKYLDTGDGALVNWVRAASWENGSGFKDSGYIAILTYTFEYDARLT